jgi:NAD(P)-dependent dehydrogenase (short-subunit alcohol dehydrogenase family)
MELKDSSTIVTGGASGLGLATVRELASRGAVVTVIDLATSKGVTVADELGSKVQFVPCDITDSDQIGHALDRAEERGPIRVLVHCAGRGGTVRLVGRDGSPGDQSLFEDIVNVNLFGTFNVLRQVAARMAGNNAVDGERGVCVLTSSVAAWEGQIGQIAYASSKAGIVGMTLVAARDLASKLIRVTTVAPGIFDTPILDRFSDEIRQGLAAQIPHPSRLGRPDEFASLVREIVNNQMLNGETIRLDGAVRMQPR